MVTSITKRLLATLVVAMAVLAAPIDNTLGMIAFTQDTIPKPDGAYDLCTGVQHHIVDRTDYAANWTDCLAIRDFALNNNGRWTLNNTASHDHWNVLRRENNCVLLVQSSVNTMVGNQDVLDLLEGIRIADHITEGPIEVGGAFTGCRPNENVFFWLRDSGPL